MRDLAIPFLEKYIAQHLPVVKRRCQLSHFDPYETEAHKRTFATTALVIRLFPDHDLEELLTVRKPENY